jgi:hypothetical protein
VKENAMKAPSKIVIAALLGVVLGVAGLRCAQGSWPIGTAHAAIGDVTAMSGDARVIEMLSSATAVNSPPAGASAGISVNDLSIFGIPPARMVLAIASTAGSGTMTATFRLWGYLPVGGGLWVPLGPGGDTAKGVLNLEAAIGETSADSIRHAEVIENPGMFQRLYLEITAIGGTATAVTAWFVVRRPGS